jgi:hypothetical protein
MARYAPKGARLVPATKLYKYFAPNGAKPGKPHATSGG